MSIPSMRVRIPRKHGGTLTMHAVIIKKTCPRCGGPRGDTDQAYFSINGGPKQEAEAWENPCGHLDYYHDVLIEAGVLPAEYIFAKRPRLFEDPTKNEIRVYHLTQWDWTRHGSTERECAKLTAPEIWEMPK